LHNRSAGSCGARRRSDDPIIPIEEYVEKIQYACRERDRIDRNFLIIARTDSCRFFGIEEAAKRVNAAAKVGADMGLMFPRNPDEAACAPKLTHVPLIYVQSLGNRDGRPTFSRQELCRLWAMPAASRRNSPCSTPSPP
jgi:2-methylisocitrate lyase-like PEP mutase family enzyme